MPIANMCDLVSPAEAAAAMGAPVDAAASSSPEACAYVSTAPGPGATDNANLSFGLDTFNGSGRAAFDKARDRLQITDVTGVANAAILEDNNNGTGKMIFIKGDTLFDLNVSTGAASQSVTDALVKLAKLLASRV